MYTTVQLTGIRLPVYLHHGTTHWHQASSLSTPRYDSLVSGFQFICGKVQLTGIRLTQATGVGTLDTGEVMVGCAGLRDIQQYRAAVGVAVSASL